MTSKTIKTDDGVVVAIDRVASLSSDDNPPSPVSISTPTANTNLKSQPPTIDTNAAPTPKSPNDPAPTDTPNTRRRKENNRESEKAKAQFLTLGEHKRKKFGKFHWFLVIGSLVTPLLYTIFFIFALARIGEPMRTASLSDALQNSYIESIIFIFLGGVVAMIITMARSVQIEVIYVRYDAYVYCRWV